MRQGLSYFRSTILQGVPAFYRRIDTALKQIGAPPLPIDHQLFKFGSWMGGDRDGNPFVTAETTRDVIITARLVAVDVLFNLIESLMFELSIWRCNDDVLVRSLAQVSRLRSLVFPFFPWFCLNFPPSVFMFCLDWHFPLFSFRAGIECKSSFLPPPRGMWSDEPLQAAEANSVVYSLCEKSSKSLTPSKWRPFAEVKMRP